MKVSQITLRWAGLKIQNGSKNLAIVRGRVRDDVEKNTSEEKRQMKNNSNNKMKINITKTSGGSFKQAPLLEGFDYFMFINDYF